MALSSLKHNSAAVVHDTLAIAGDVLPYTPIPGLAAAAKVLLSIWDAVQKVDVSSLISRLETHTDELTKSNRLACLRLTERCAEILIAVREEVWLLGEDVAEELASPMGKLELSVLIILCRYLADDVNTNRAFRSLLHFLCSQTNQPFLKRYVRRDDMLQEIAACDTTLTDCLNNFDVRLHYFPRLRI